MMQVGKAAVIHIGPPEVHSGTFDFHPWRATGYRFAHGCLEQKCMLKTAAFLIYKERKVRTFPLQNSKFLSI